MRELELVGRCRSLPPICQWLEAKKAMSVTHRDNSVEIVSGVGSAVGTATADGAVQAASMASNNSPKPVKAGR